MKQEQYTEKLEHLVSKFNLYNERAKIQGSPHFNLQGWYSVIASWYAFRIEYLNEKAFYESIEIPKCNKESRSDRIIIGEGK